MILHMKFLKGLVQAFFVIIIIDIFSVLFQSDKKTVPIILVLNQIFLCHISMATLFIYLFLFINLFKVDDDKRDTVNKNTHKIAKG